MQFFPTTVLGFFDSSQKSYIVPVYQRAYSWEQKQWKAFIDDLIEQSAGGNSYNYGYILLETIKKEKKYEIIDGQQRLTTIIIFMRALLDVLSDNNADFADKCQHIRDTYLKNNGNIKLRPVEYDRACFERLIIDGEKNFSTTSISQQRIKGAKIYFTKEFGQYSGSKLIKLLDELELADIARLELQGKKESALMFELQNNRGKDLTNLEKLKSYFMYQMYAHSTEEETESNIEHVSDIFKSIYLAINDLNRLDEDSVLIYHCNAYLNGYNYRGLENIIEYLAKATNRVLWIKEFTGKLHSSFINMGKVERSRLPYLLDLRTMTGKADQLPAFVYPFIIKGYSFFGEDNIKMNKLYHLLEILTFRYHLINSRADINSRLNDVLKKFDGDIYKLKTSINDKLEESWYWSEARTKEYLDDYMYENKVLKYLLWKYEDYLQSKGYGIGECKIAKVQTEHISPKIPPDNIQIASGYEVDANNEYSEEFKTSYLHCVGNLMLISESHNKSIGNIAFAKKLETYKKSASALRQMQEIEEFVDDKDDPLWGVDAIDKRHEAIVDNFAAKKWSYESLSE